MNANSIVRATVASSAELGLFSSALLLFRIGFAAGTASVDDLVRRCGRSMPLFDALARRGLPPVRVAGMLDDVADDVGPWLGDGITDAVCTAMEAELVDRLVRRYGGCRFTVVRHDGAADASRVAENYGPNFRFVDDHEVDSVASPISTVLLVPVFDTVSDGYVAAYPNARRLMGPDSSARFAEVVAVDLLGSRFHYRPADLVRIPVNEFTQIVHVPVVGRFTSRYEEVAA